MKRTLFLVGLFLVLDAARLQYFGVNEAGAEFAEQKVPGVLGKDYIFPTKESIEYFISNGMNVIRIPFLWERYQPTLDSVDPTYQRLFENVVKNVTSRGSYALIDPHNYLKYRGNTLGSSVPISALKNLWIILSKRFANDPKVLFGLMNEPNSVKTELVLECMQSAIDGIRSTGSKHLVLVPGNAWTGAWSWTQNWYGTPNAQVMKKIRDPANNFAFELHQYLDNGYSGTNENCQNLDPSTVLGPTTQALRSNGSKAFIGEFGFGGNDNCLKVGEAFFQYFEQNSDVYIGMTWWAAGPWWGNYFMSVEPPKVAPQMALLKKHASGKPDPTSASSQKTSQVSSKTSQQPPVTTSSQCSALYGQCGGKSWTGAKCCQEGTCKPQNEWYSQCLP